MNKQYSIGAISMDINTKALNYGSWLHSYAFQAFVNGSIKNVSCEIIDYKRPDQEKLNLRHPGLFYFKEGNYKEFLKYALFFRRHSARFKKFQAFKGSMPISSIGYTLDTLSTATLKYDLLVCDSDTIWTPRSNGKYDEAYFLALPSMKSIPKIAYSPSMGNAQVPKELESKLKLYLSHFSFISCRESYEKDVLQRFTKKEISHVLDPVFLLPKEAYLSQIKKTYRKGKYLLIYQPVDKNEHLLNLALKYAKEHHLKIFEISTSVYQRRDRRIKLDYKAGPLDFLAAINGAQCVFTNSFHAICFSLLFETQFYAFGRKDNLKVIDICSRFGLGARYLRDGDALTIGDINYSEVTKTVKELSEASKKWLTSAIASCLAG